MTQFKYTKIYKIAKAKFYIYFAKHIANSIYKKKFGRNINWSNPIEFNEKIRFLQFNSDISKWVLLADKYKVREYLCQIGCGELLVDLYGVWESAYDIDFSKLPLSFVLKTNNGCGDVIIVKDKSNINEAEIRKRISNSLASPFGLNSAQIHYYRIKGYIIAEEYIENDAEYSSSVVDYKFYCFNGNPMICGVFYDRIANSHDTNSTFYDMNWNRHDEWRSPTISFPPKEIPRPKKLREMINVCKKLTKGLPFVRLDLYYINNKIYFGEYTFTPAACCGGSLNPDIFYMLGSMIKIS